MVSSGTSMPAFRAAHRRIGVLRIGRIPPAPKGIVPGAGHRAPRGQFERLPERAALLTAGRCLGPEHSVVDGSVGLGQGEHAEAVLVHAVLTLPRPEKSGLGVLGGDHAPQRLADRHAIRSVVRIFARGEQGHHRHTGHAGAGLAILPGSGVVLALEQVPQARVVHLADVTGHGIAVANQGPGGGRRGGDQRGRRPETCLPPRAVPARRFHHRRSFSNELK